MKRIWGTLFFFVCAVTLFTACGGSRGGGDKGGVEPAAPVLPVAEPTAPTLAAIKLPGQALLGTLVNASVKLFRLDDFTQPIATTQTQNSADLSIAGTFALPQTTISSEELYLVVVEGGMDINSNNDRVASSPVPNVGKLHALVPGSVILEQSAFNVSLVSELLYQRLRFLLATGTRDTTTLKKEIAFRAQQLLAYDLTNNDFIDINDVLKWHPVNHSNALRASTDLQPNVIAKLRNGESVARYAIEWMSHTLASYESSVSSDIVIAYNNLLLSADAERGLVIYAAEDVELRELSATLIPHNDPSGLTPYWGLTDLVVADLVVVAAGVYVTASGEPHHALLTIDMRDPGQPVLLGTLALDNNLLLTRLQFYDGMLFGIANNSPGTLAMFDISTPSQPVRLADLVTGAPAVRDILMFHSTLYIATGNELLIFNVENYPLSLRLVSSTGGNFDTLGMGEDDSTLINVNGDIEVYFVFTGKPTLSSRVVRPSGIVGVDSYAGRPVFSGDTFFIGAVEGGTSISGEIQQFDLRNPREPRLLGTLAASVAAVKAYYANGQLYVLNVSGKIKIVSTDLAKSNQVRGVVNLAVSGGLLADRNLLHQFDFPSMTTFSSDALMQGSPVNTPLQRLTNHNVRRVKVRDSATFISGTRNLLDIYRFGSDGAGMLLGTVPTADTMVIAELLVSEGFAWVIARRSAESQFSLFVIDIIDLANPVVVNESPLNFAKVSYAAMIGSALFIQSGGTISIVDVNNPAAPQPMGTLRTTAFPVALAVHDNILFVVTTLGDPDRQSNDAAIEIFDASAGALSPNAAGRVVLANDVRFGMGFWKDSAVVRNGTLYLAFGEKGTYAVDITDIAKPSLLGQLDSIGPAASVAVIANNVVTVLDATGHLNLFSGVVQTTLP